MADNISRRNFLTWIANSSIVVSLMGFFAVIIKYLTPNVLFEPPTSFKVGVPSNFPEGTTTFLSEKKLFIINNNDNYTAISSVCTHLGCTVNLTPEKQFHCPCHGSIFESNGDVVTGPAQYPLVHYKIYLSRDMYLVVDTNKIVKSDYKLTV